MSPLIDLEMWLDLVSILHVSFSLPLFSIFLSLLAFGKIKMGRLYDRGSSMGDANEKNRKWDDDDLITGVLLEGKS